MSNYKFLTVGIGICFVFLLGMGWLYSQATLVGSEVAILQGTISIQPLRPLEDPQKVQPGTPVKLKVAIENKGLKASPSGHAYIQFAFAKPFHKETNSEIFQTEKVELPSIEPGKTFEIQFTTTHQLPSLFDFVRYDWSMREYQAVVDVDQTEKIIGTLSITVSAYFYPGIRKLFPTQIAIENP